jgi:hypothetical protein
LTSGGTAAKARGAEWQLSANIKEAKHLVQMDCRLNQARDYVEQA